MENEYQILENDVGITEYLNKNSKGFFGILKSRFEDFLVSEISLDGKVAQFDGEFSSESMVEKENANKREEVPKELENYIDELKELQSGVRTVVQIDQPATKEIRTSIHTYIKSLYKDLESVTVNGNIIIRKPSGKPQRAKEHVYEFLRFVLYKENRDTQDAVSTIARLLHVNPKLFGFAGTKDKRAKTAQFVTAKRIPLSKFERIADQLKNIKIFGFEPFDKALSLGDLSMNEFTVILRKVEGEIGEMEKSLQGCLEHGFINYYGMQRFGLTTDSRTDKVGLLILQQKYKEAVDLIIGAGAQLAFKEDDSAAARQEWQQSRDAEKALKLFPRRFIAERCILEHLIKNPNNYLQAIMTIRRNIRLMYVHAYQSLLWNKCASARIILGPKVLIGDLVMDNGNVILVNDDQMADRFTFADVVLPLPGKSVTYPRNEIGKLYKSLLEADNLSLEMSHKEKDFELSGDYRKVISIPQRMSWKFIRYDKEDESIDITQEEENENKLNIAIVIKFALNTSSYATMAVREMLKMPTMSQYHARLS